MFRDLKRLESRDRETIRVLMSTSDATGRRRRLKMDRLILDGLGSLSAIAAKLHEIVPDLPSRVPVEGLYRQLDILLDRGDRHRKLRDGPDHERDQGKRSHPAGSRAIDSAMAVLDRA